MDGKDPQKEKGSHFSQLNDRKKTRQLPKSKDAGGKLPQLQAPDQGTAKPAGIMEG